jgi:hypothetical protein
MPILKFILEKLNLEKKLIEDTNMSKNGYMTILIIFARKGERFAIKIKNVPKTVATGTVQRTSGFTRKLITLTLPK